MSQVVTAQEEERRRISRDIHDQMGQHLTGFALALRALEDAYPPGDADARPLLGRLRGVADALGRDLHRLAVDLRPTSLDDLGLVRALSAYTDDWAERTGVRVDFQAVRMGGGRLPGAVETALYRIAQEALNNVAKYGGARLVTVLLRREPPAAGGTPEQAVLIVEDDGRGFDADAATSSTEDVRAAAAVVAGPGRPRLGLLGMQERAALLGGTFAVESSPGGGGTTVFVRIPLGRPESDPTRAE